MDLVKIAPLLAAISGITFGMEPIFAKLLYATGVNTPTLLVMRYFFATIAIWLVVVAKRMDLREVKSSLKLIIPMGLIMLPLPTSSLMYSFNFIPASVGIICMYCFPIYVTIWEALFLKQHITAKKVLCLLITFVGLILVIGFPEGEIVFKGVFFALLASFIYSIIIMINSRIVKNVQPVLINAIYAICTLVAISVVVVGTDQLDMSFGVREWLLFVGLGVLATTVPNLTFLIATKYISVSRASITSMLEPVATAIFAYIILGDSLTAMQLLGMIAVLFGIWLLQQTKLTIGSKKVEQSGDN